MRLVSSHWGWQELSWDGSTVMCSTEAYQVGLITHCSEGCHGTSQLSVTSFGLVLGDLNLDHHKVIHLNSLAYSS